MLVLPLRFIHGDEKYLLGSQVLNLVKLQRHKFPIAETLIFSPPKDKFSFFVSQLQNHPNLILEKFDHLKSQALNLDLPADLSENLSQMSEAEKNKIWKDLLNIWLDQLKSIIWREGLAKAVDKLDLVPLVLTDKISASGKLWFNELEKDSVIEVETGELSPKELQFLDQLVVKMNKVLFIPHIYCFVLETRGRELKIVKISPQTNFIPKNQAVLEDTTALALELHKDKKVNKNAIKLFFRLGENFIFDKSTDGIIVEAEKYPDFDHKVLSLVESAKSFPQSKVLFKMSEENSLATFKEDSEVFLFARNRQKLYNLELILPPVRSLDQLLRIKRDLSVAGLNRKGPLKFWFYATFPENLINIESYLTLGFDGVIFNLDQLNFHLLGLDKDSDQGYLYKGEYSSLLNLVSAAIKILHKQKIPAVALGELAFKDEVLNFLVSRGVWGVIVTQAETHYIPERLQEIERKIPFSLA